MRYASWIIVALASCVAIGGCGQQQRPGFPAQSYDEKQLIEDLEEKFDLPTKINSYYADKANLTNDDRQTRRDEIITSRLTLINLHYNQFVADASFRRQVMDFSADIANLGVGLATAVVGSAATKTVLGAISAGITGSHASLHKNFYFEKTVSAIVATMNANRKLALFPILTGQRKSIQAYPLGQALSDLDNYYFAGTFLGALNAIVMDAGKTEGEADRALRIVSFSEDETAIRIKRWIWPDYPDVRAINAANVQALNDWLAKDENKQADGEVLPIQRLLDAAGLGAMRNRAIAALNIQ